MIQVIKCANHEEWLALRKEGIGSSEVATLVGLNPYETPYSLWRRKIGVDPAIPENRLMRLGHLLEGSVAQLFADETGAIIDEESEGDIIVYNEELPHLRVSPDRFYSHSGSERYILECKTTQMTVDRDDIPMWWFAQLQFQLGVSGVKHGALAWLSRGRDFGYQEFELVPEYYDYLAKKATGFWHENVQGRKEPAPVNSDDILKLYGAGDEEKAEEATEEIFHAVEELKEVREKIAELEVEKKEYEESIKLYLKDSTLLTYNGVDLATWKAPRPSQVFDTKRFREDHPELAAEYMKERANSRRFVLR